LDLDPCDHDGDHRNGHAEAAGELSLSLEKGRRNAMSKGAAHLHAEKVIGDDSE
jgi:hypothetical protein